jgi:hypothetical protein
MNEWLSRGTAVYGGGSAVDVPVSVAGDSFYYVPTHEVNAGCAVIAYHMQSDGDAAEGIAGPDGNTLGRRVESDSETALGLGYATDETTEARPRRAAR